MFKELHHRVKNNLQVISSLLRMQGDHLKEPAAHRTLEESRQRIFSIALIHERLYSGRQVNEIDFGSYAKALIDDLIRSYSTLSFVSARLTSARILLDVDQAIPCGLILNELVTNALKYAYPQGHGEIAIELKEDSQHQVTLTVADHGVGMPAGFDPAGSKTLGITIVKILARQLGGTLDIQSLNGAQFSIQFQREVKTSKNLSAA